MDSQALFRLSKHKATSFDEEYRRLLQAYEVEYDERYVWD